MSYRIYLESYAWMNEKKAVKRGDYKAEQKEDVVRRIYFRDPDQKRQGTRAEFLIIMRNFNADRIHLEERIWNGGRVFSKTVWLPREECEKILANDLDWMAERESVIFDLYYHITHEGYRMVSMDEGREQVISEEGNGQITILEREKRQLLPGKETFFVEKPEWMRTLHPGKCRVLRRKECLLPQAALEMLCLGEN